MLMFIGIAVGVLCFALIVSAMVQILCMREPECLYAPDEMLIDGIDPCRDCDDTRCIYELVEL